MPRRVLVLLVVASIGCGAAQETSREPVSERDGPDRCHVLPRSCLEGVDPTEDDGCPLPATIELVFDAESAEPTDAVERELGEVAMDAAHLVPGATITLAAVEVDLGPARLDAVRRALVEAGVPIDRVLDALAPPAPRPDEPWDPDGVVLTVDGCL